jgi:DNA (cytosine-5)-methyltransferase 1
MLLGHRTVCAVEFDAYARSVLLARQADGTFPTFPVWDDVRTFDGTPWRGIVDVVSGGFPCQDLSVAGKGAGLDGKRSGLWREMARIIGEVRPRYAFIENSPALITRGLDRVLCDLAALGFDARWGVLGASDVGAPHKRERIWILGYSRSFGRDTGRKNHRQDDGAIIGSDGQHASEVADTNGERPHGAGICRAGRVEFEDGGCSMANPDSLRELQPQWSECIERGWVGNCCSDVANSNSIQGLESETQPSEHGRPAGLFGGTREFQHWPADPADAPESKLGRVVDGLANRANRIKAIGNGQVPRVRAAAWRILTHNG